MFGLKRIIPHARSIRASIAASQHPGHLEPQRLAQLISNRFLDIYQLGNKKEIEKERARLAQATWWKAMAAKNFPEFEVSYSDGKVLKLPIKFNADIVKANSTTFPGATLLCLSFRASSQAMIDSWSAPLLDAFSSSKDVQLYEVSFIDSWFLCWNPVKKVLLRLMRKSNDDAQKDALRRQIVYSFGDHYYFRKELKILNLLTGYIFLLDKFGRIRWQGFGLATEEELSSLLSCISLLLDEK